MTEILDPACIRLGCEATDKNDAISQCGEVFVEAGVAGPEYARAMFDREEQISTYLGEGFAIPHGTNESREHIRRTGLGFLQFPSGVDWDGETVYVCIPIASNSDEHIEILSALATTLLDAEQAQALINATDPTDVLAILSPTRKDQ